MSYELASQVMDAAEARACVTAINARLNGARQLLLELYEREGWRVLGYDSWRECVVAEFQQSKTHLYRQLEAARVEREISPIGEMPSLSDYHLGQIAQLPPQDRREVALSLARNGDLSVKDHRRIIAEKQREVVKRPHMQLEFRQPRPLAVVDALGVRAVAFPARLPIAFEHRLRTIGKRRELLRSAERGDGQRRSEG